MGMRVDIRGKKKTERKKKEKQENEDVNRGEIHPTKNDERSNK
jgi:hypothetical protein